MTKAKGTPLAAFVKVARLAETLVPQYNAATKSVWRFEIPTQVFVDDAGRTMPMQRLDGRPIRERRPRREARRARKRK